MRERRTVLTIFVDHGEVDSKSHVNVSDGIICSNSPAQLNNGQLWLLSPVAKNVYGP